MSYLDYGIVIVYLTGIVILGFLLQKRASTGIDSYFLGNRKMPWWALGASGMASNLDVSGTMINTAFIFALGAMGLFIEIRGGVTLIMAFLMIFMGKWNRRAQVMTMAEWMRFRFGKERQGDIARLMAAASIIVVTIAMVTYFAVGSGKFISTFLGIPDIGKVTDQFDENEQISISNYLVEIKYQQEALITITKEMKETNAGISGMTRASERLNTTWGKLQQNGGSVAQLSKFGIEIKEFEATVKSLKSTTGTLSVSYSDSTLAGVTSGINYLEENTKKLYQIYEEAASFSILIKGEFLASLLMIFLAMIYTVASGLYGVVWTDVFQGILIFGTIAYICVLAATKFHVPEIFSVSIPMKDGTFQAVQMTRESWTNIVPPWKLDFPADSAYSIYSLFGIAIIFYLIKVTIEGSGGTSGYMIQRYYAARSDRETGLLSLFWTFLLSFRWPFIAAIAIMGISYGASNGVISDPEKVLPVVVSEMVPMGIKGLLVAGLMAAAMSTFDSTVNAGAAYWVKDIYQAYINPKATEKNLLLHSRWASVIIVVFGLLFSLAIKNINEIWGWITMSIGAGMIVPTLVRWYWWRLNGWGFAIGTAAGMIAAVIQRLVFPDVPEYVAFSFASGISFVAMIIATYATSPTDEKTLSEFYKTTRPFGFWKNVREKIPTHIMEKVNKENRRDIISIFMAVPWQVILFLTMMMIVMGRWDYFAYLLFALTVLSVGLYFSWYRHLSTEVKIESVNEK
jgi:solute:Na+ symporter, SSS family